MQRFIRRVLLKDLAVVEFLCLCAGKIPIICIFKRTKTLQITVNLLGDSFDYLLLVKTMTKHTMTHTGQHAPYATGPNMQNKHNQHNTIIQT
jgi:hypothetical protein